MASEYRKTKAFERGVNGKTPRSPFSLGVPDKDEVRANQAGKRIKAVRDDAERRRRKGK